MTLGLHKPGQGYWMRVITAAMLGTLFLAMAMWVASQAARVAANLPTTSYSAVLHANATGTPPAPGTRLVLLGESQGNQMPPVIGSGIVSSYDAENRRMVFKVGEITNTNYSIGDTARLRTEAEPGSAGAYNASLVDSPRGQAVVEPVLIQGIAASIILLIGAILTYWFCGTNRKSVDFLINTDMEMKKVNWSTRKDIIGSTWVVIGSSFLIAAFIFFTDFIMQAIFKAIGVLHT